MKEYFCQLCTNEYSDDEKHAPRILTSCGHTVCDECAQKLLKNGKVICPFDRIVSNVPEGRTINLKKNFKIIEIIAEEKWRKKLIECGELDESTSTDSLFKKEIDMKIPCDQDKNHVAIFYCVSCSVHFCKRCSISVHSAPIFDSHTVVKVSEKPQPMVFCPKHMHNVADLYCKETSCNEPKLMCTTCHLYQDHKNHQYELLEQKFKKINEKIQKSIEVGDEKTKQAIELCSEIEKALDTSSINAIKLNARRKIENHCINLQKKINEWKESSIEKVNSSVEVIVTKLEDKVHPIKVFINEIERNQRTLKSIDGYNSLRLLKEFDNIEESSDLILNIKLEKVSIHNLNPNVGIKLPCVPPLDTQCFNYRKIHLMSTFEKSIGNMVQFINEESSELENNLRFYKNTCLQITSGEVPQDLEFATIIYTFNYYYSEEVENLKNLKNILVKFKSSSIRFVAAVHMWCSEKRRGDLEDEINSIVASDKRVTFKYYDIEYKDQCLDLINFVLELSE